MFDPMQKQNTHGRFFLANDFQATIFVDRIEETIRHLAVTANGIVHAKLYYAGEKGSIKV